MGARRPRLDEGAAVLPQPTRSDGPYRRPAFGTPRRSETPRGEPIVIQFESDKDKIEVATRPEHQALVSGGVSPPGAEASGADCHFRGTFLTLGHGVVLWPDTRRWFKLGGPRAPGRPIDVRERHVSQTNAELQNTLERPVKDRSPASVQRPPWRRFGECAQCSRSSRVAANSDHAFDHNGRRATLLAESAIDLRSGASTPRSVTLFVMTGPA